jgi:hypothetical protein
VSFVIGDSGDSGESALQVILVEMSVFKKVKEVRMSFFGSWLCRHGIHQHEDNGNCMRCGWRYHGGHVGDYARWVKEGRVKGG